MPPRAMTDKTDRFFTQSPDNGLCFFLFKNFFLENFVYIREVSGMNAFGGSS